MAVEEEWDYSFLWRIENYTSCRQELGIELVSPTFTVDALGGSKWYLSIYPGGYKEEYKKFVSIYICKNKNNPSDDEHIVTYKIEVKTQNGYVIVTEEDQNAFKNWDAYGDSEFVEREELLSKLMNESSDTIILHCFLKRSDKCSHEQEKCEAQTRIIRDKCVFEWTVNFLRDPPLVKGKTHFFLESILYEVSINILQDDVILKIQKIMNKCSSYSHINGKIALLDVRGNVVFSEQNTHLFNGQTETEIWQFPSFISTKQLQDASKDCVENGTGVFLCEFFAISREKSKRREKSKNLASVSRFESLLNFREDFQNLLAHRNLPDAKLVVEDEKLDVHRSVLAARSPVFSTMFDHEMRENMTGIVEVKDADLNTMKSFIGFLYTGEVNDMDYESASKLLVVADKYQVPSLVKECVLFLASVLSVKNVCETLLLADMIVHEQLKNTCVEYISRKVKRIFTSLEWATLVQENPTLSIEVNAFIGKNCAVSNP